MQDTKHVMSQSDQRSPQSRRFTWITARVSPARSGEELTNIVHRAEHKLDLGRVGSACDVRICVRQLKSSSTRSEDYSQICFALDWFRPTNRDEK